MKTKKLKAKLSLNKETITDMMMTNLRGGGVPDNLPLPPLDYLNTNYTCDFTCLPILSEGVGNACL